MIDKTLDYVTTGVNGVEYYTHVSEDNKEPLKKFTAWVYIDTEWRYSITYYVPDSECYTLKVTRLYLLLSHEYNDVRIVKYVK